MIFLLVLFLTLLFTFSCLLSLYPLFVIIFSILIGLMKYLRGRSEKDKRLFLISVSIASLTLSCILLIGISEGLSDVTLLYRIGLYIFYLLFVFPLVTYTIWKINPDKSIGLLIIGMMILSFILVTPYYSTKTYPVNHASVWESVKKDIVPNLLSDEREIINNGEVKYLDYYAWPAVLIKNKVLGYGIFLVELIGIAGVVVNETHYSLFLGAGVGVIYFSTDFNKIVAEGLQFSFIIKPYVDREPIKTVVSIGYSQDYYIKAYHLLYAKQTNRIPETLAILYSNWSIEAIASEGEKFTLETPFHFSEVINVTISESGYAFSPRFYPEEIYSYPIELPINYSPKLNLIETIYFYKYELFTILTLLFILEITREYLPEITETIKTIFTSG